MLSLTEMEKELHDIWNKNSLRIVSLQENEIEKVYNLWILNIFEEPTTHVELYCYGCYFTHIKKDLKKGKMYYRMASAGGNIHAHNALGRYYIKKNPIKSLTYFKMGAEKGDMYSMFNLGKHYYDTGNITKANKWLEMVKKIGDEDLLNNLGCLYFKINDYIKAKECFKLSIKRGGKGIVYNNLAINYRKYSNYKEKLTKIFYYYSLYGENIVSIETAFSEINKEHIPLDKYFYDALIVLKKIVDKLSPVIVLCINTYTKEINILELSLKYQPGGEGYLEAKKNFEELLSSR